MKHHREKNGQRPDSGVEDPGSMALKGAAPDHEGEPRPDRWPLTPELAEVGARWGIDPARDLTPA